MRILAAIAIAWALQSGPLTGTVADQSGAAIAGALVVAHLAGDVTLRTTSAGDGRFSFPDAAAIVSLTVRSPGFGEAHLDTSGAEAVTVTLRPASITQTIVVAATDTPARPAELPADVTVLRHERIDLSPALTADDVLRQVPAFSLFRRSSSLAAHPTTQGVSLRGIGPSGVSRTLVLLDDIPLNDPFGGWIYWTRVPTTAVDRIEVVESSAASLYGDYAMGGVISIVTAPQRRLLDVRTQAGSFETTRLAAGGGGAYDGLGLAVDVSSLRTDGYPTVAAAERGRVDTNAGVDVVNATGSLRYDPSARLHAFVRGTYFSEDRQNGRISTVDGTPEGNSTIWRSIEGGGRTLVGSSSTFEATVSGSREQFLSNYLSVPAASPPRSIGRMVLNQRVPVGAQRASANWSTAAGSRLVLSAGFEMQRVHGDSVEDALDNVTGTIPTLHRVAGGRQTTVGGFAQGLFTPTAKLTVTLGLRRDRWRNYGGHNLETCLNAFTCSPNNVPDFPDRRERAVSPRAGVRYQLHSRINVWGAASAGFRAPTLNELYRQFRVGATLTLANSDLTAERLRGYEGGVNLSISRGLDFRVTAFDDRLRDPISNATVSTSGATVIQRRENLGRTRARGIEADAEWRWRDRFTLTAAYVHNDAIVLANSSSPQLVGKWLPQVPRHRGSVQLSYGHPRAALVGVEAMLTSGQFDDDLNTPARLLPRYATVDASVSRQFGRRFEAFAGAQNLFNTTVIVGTLPTSIGAPRLMSGGVRVRLGNAVR
jgi:outer membrane receptor protein involved in Fe transport